MKKILLPLALSVLAFSSAFATPVPLSPGGTVTAFTPSATTFAGTLVGTYTMTFSNVFENGSVLENVYNNGGTLDFYYQVTNSATSIDSLSRVTVGNFQGFNTSVDYVVSGGIVPYEATRQSSGTSVGFFINLNPGTSSDFLEVSTNATAFNSTGTIGLLDSIGANLTQALAPAVPEPSTCCLLLGGLGLAAIWRLRRLAL